MRKQPPKSIHSFYCEIEKTERYYSLGLNEGKTAASEGRFREIDSIMIHCAVRRHECSYKKPRRTFKHVELSLRQTWHELNMWPSDANDVGDVYHARAGVIHGSLYLPKGSLAALLPFLASGKMKELWFLLHDLEHNHGRISSFSFSSEQTPEEDM